ncbi:hypothetical protein [Neisseria weaveri]|uniref:hypothetical protein n=1 Tax=Neisseria weaveri TaxID=28091 RepID=UPI00131B9FC7|nr:hypothetical protein [Neisseria weaveri]
MAFKHEFAGVAEIVGLSEVQVFEVDMVGIDDFVGFLVGRFLTLTRLHAEQRIVVG